MYYEVLVAAQQFHGQENLTYRSSESLRSGQLVTVPLQRRLVVAIVVSKVSKPLFATKQIVQIYPVFLPELSLDLIKWLREYYPAPLGAIAELFTPPNLPQKLPALSDNQDQIKKLALPPLTKEQLSVIRAIEQSSQRSIMIHGDTGTGKTRVYIELARQSLEANRSVIILTPEIGLAGSLFEVFQKVFGSQVFMTHSDMTVAKRRSIWLKASISQQPLVIIGPRSALFLPLKNIGLIVMDEAHDSAYKQERAPYYQTSRVASQLAYLHKACFIMGSATPLITDYFTFLNKGLPIIRMTQSAIKHTQHVGSKIIDLRAKEQFNKSVWIADELLKAVSEALKKGEQSLLFLNRRGSARLVLCDNCGWQALCPRCDVALVYHHDLHAMRCHSCDFSDKVPAVCPSCSASELVFRSIGTKALELEISKLFPEALIGRFDRDTAKPLRLNEQHHLLRNGQLNVLIGTQSIVKGFDLPKLSVVGIIQADSGLQIPDYTANERTYQLISQVSGRIGRGHRAGRLFVQSYHPESNLIKLAITKNYDDFYRQELRQRELYSFPPFVYILKINCSRASRESAIRACQKLADSILKLGNKVTIEGPTPAFIEKLGKRYTWHLIIKSKARDNLIQIIYSLSGAYIYDLDPNDLL